MKKHIVFENSYLSIIPSRNFLASIQIVNEKLNSFFEDKEPNYQNQAQMTEYLTTQGHENIIAEII